MPESLLQLTVGNLRAVHKQALGASVICVRVASPKENRTSILGNPFRMFAQTAGDSERSAVMEGFRSYLHLVANQGEKPGWAANQVVIREGLTLAPSWITPTSEEFKAELERIGQMVQKKPLTLLCWCAPRA